MKVKPPMTDFVKDSHCSYCGTKFTEQKEWPRKCFRCWNESYKNPIPIVVAIVRVFQRDTNTQCGWLIQQRNIPPEKDGWAFPSGYINFGETWQQAAARELQEEVGLVSSPDDYELYDVVASSTGNMLIFCIHRDGVYQDEVKFEPNEEVSAVQSIHYSNADCERELTFTIIKNRNSMPVIKHYHHCPVCYEHWQCDHNCTIEPDLEDNGKYLTKEFWDVYNGFVRVRRKQ
jgi:ADP-ribose pyrophosphatase YjhB (NUDIX family)